MKELSNLLIEILTLTNLAENLLCKINQLGKQQPPVNSSIDDISQLTKVSLNCSNFFRRLANCTTF